MDETKHDENTPRDAVREFVVAFMTLDADRMEACTSGEQLDRDHTRAFLDMMAANRAFMVKFIATYGVTAWDEFNDNAGGHLRMQPQQDEEAAVQRADKVRIKVTGDTAIGTAPGESDQIHFVRDGGRWFVSLRETTALPAEQLASDGRLYAALTRLVRAKMARIGADGVTPESLDKEMGEAMQPHFAASER